MLRPHRFSPLMRDGVGVLLAPIGARGVFEQGAKAHSLQTGRGFPLQAAKVSDSGIQIDQFHDASG